MTDDTKTIVEHVRRTIKPETIVAIGLDGQETTLAIGHLKTRWDRLGKLLDGMDWAKLKCLDAAGNLVSIVDAPGDMDAAAAHTDDPIAAQLGVVATLIDNLMRHIRGASGDVTNALIAALADATTRNAELSAQVGQLQQQLMESFNTIRELMLEHVAAGGTLEPKEQALLAGLGAAGEKFLNLPHGWMFPAQPTKQLSGNGEGGK